MNSEFDFKKVGKQMPYSVPDNFFDDLEKDIMEKVKQESEPVKATKNKAILRFLWPTILGAAAAVACLIVLPLKFMPSSTTDDKAMAQSYSPNTAQVDEEQAFDKLSNEDQEYLLDIYNDDVFIEEVNN